MKAVLAITGGPRQTEFMFRSSNFVLEQGKVSSLMTEGDSGGASVQVEGTGIATEESGKLTLKMGQARQFSAVWEDEELVFVKEGKESIVDRLQRNDSRARALVAGTAAPSSGVKTIK